MREYKEVNFHFIGDIDTAKIYIPESRKYLGILKNDMKFNNIKYNKRDIRIDDYTTIRVISNNGIDTIYIESTPREKKVVDLDLTLLVNQTYIDDFGVDNVMGGPETFDVYKRTKSTPYFSKIWKYKAVKINPLPQPAKARSVCSVGYMPGNNTIIGWGLQHSESFPTYSTFYSEIYRSKSNGFTNWEVLNDNAPNNGIYAKFYTYLNWWHSGDTSAVTIRVDPSDALYGIINPVEGRTYNDWQKFKFYLSSDVINTDTPTWSFKGNIQFPNTESYNLYPHIDRPWVIYYNRVSGNRTILLAGISTEPDSVVKPCIAKSIDSGTTWSYTSYNLSGIYNTYDMYYPQSPRLLPLSETEWLMFCISSDRSKTSVFKTLDSGSTFNQIAILNYPLMLNCAEEPPELIYLGNDNLMVFGGCFILVSNDRGITWKEMTTATGIKYSSEPGRDVPRHVLTRTLGNLPTLVEEI